MKKISVVCGVFALSTLLFSSAFAQSSGDSDYGTLFDAIDNAEGVGGSGDTTFGFKNTDVIKISDTTSSSIKVTSPVVTDGDTTILNYDITLSLKPYKDLTSTEQKAAIIESCNFSNIALKDKTEFTCNIPVSKIDTTKKYYLTIFPKNSAGKIGDNSSDIVLDYNALMKKDNTTSNTNNTHGSALDMCAANISYEQDNDKVTVTWKALVESGKLRINARGSNENDFKTVGTANITDEKFTFTPSQSGTYLVKLIPLGTDGKEKGKACTQTMHLEEFTVTTVQTQTGPQETLMIIGLIAVISGYFILRRNH